VAKYFNNTKGGGAESGYAEPEASGGIDNGISREKVAIRVVVGEIRLDKKGARDEGEEEHKGFRESMIRRQRLLGREERWVVIWVWSAEIGRRWARITVRPPAPVTPGGEKLLKEMKRMGIFWVVARRVYSDTNGRDDWERVSRIRVKGEVESRRDRRREIKRRLWVRRWSRDMVDAGAVGLRGSS
jgi:hypothetical protein